MSIEFFGGTWFGFGNLPEAFPWVVSINLVPLVIVIFLDKAWNARREKEELEAEIEDQIANLKERSGS